MRRDGVSERTVPPGASPVATRVRRWLPALGLAVAGGIALVWAERAGMTSGAVRLALLAAAAPLLVTPWVPGLRRVGEARRGALLLALAVVALGQVAGEDLWRYLSTRTVRVWNVFHYYLGAEYFTELGYHDLYVAALAADEEGDDYWAAIDRVRNLETYRVEPRILGAMRFDPTRSFTPERWARFRADVAALQVQRTPEGWRDIFRDRGYNPSPFWTAVAHQLTHRLPATSLARLKLLTALDLLLMAATFVLLARGFGLATGATALFFFAVTPVNDNRLIGGSLQYDWFCAVAAGLAFVRRRWAVPAALCLGYAALARVFPLAIGGAVLLPALVRIVRRRSWRPLVADRFARRYALALALALVAGAAIGATTGRGWAAWGDFFARMAHHGEAHTYGEQRVGLKHVFTHSLAGGDDDERDSRRDTFARQEGAYRWVAVALLALWGAASWRRPPRDAALLALVVVFVLVVASRYYWALLTLLPLATAIGAGRRRRLLLDLGQVTVYGGFSAAYLVQSERYVAYVTFNALLAALLLGWLVALIGRDVAVWRRWRSVATRSAAGAPSGPRRRRRRPRR